MCHKKPTLRGGSTTVPFQWELRHQKSIVSSSKSGKFRTSLRVFYLDGKNIEMENPTTFLRRGKEDSFFSVANGGKMLLYCILIFLTPPLFYLFYKSCQTIKNHFVPNWKNWFNQTITFHTISFIVRSCCRFNLIKITQW